MLLDTAGLLALLDRREPQHQAAIDGFRSATGWLTHSYILAELLPLARIRGVPRTIALDFSRRILVDPLLQIIWIGQPLHQQALDLLAARTDKGYSLRDAVSFILMRQRGIVDALTTDRHFEQEGFRRLLS